MQKLVNENLLKMKARIPLKVVKNKKGCFQMFPD